jgi:hypothetical protein
MEIKEAPYELGSLRAWQVRGQKYGVACWDRFKRSNRFPGCRAAVQHLVSDTEFKR